MSFVEHVENGIDVPTPISSGWVIYEDGKVVLLASSISPETGNCFNVLSILKTDILERHLLTRKRVKK